MNNSIEYQIFVIGKLLYNKFETYVKTNIKTLYLACR